MFVCLSKIRRDKEEGCGGANQEPRKPRWDGVAVLKRKPYTFKLLPRVAPGPVVCFVLSEPHGHQLVPTVIEDRPAGDERRGKTNGEICFFPR